MLLSLSGDPCRQNYTPLPRVHLLLLVLAVLLGQTEHHAQAQTPIACNPGMYYAKEQDTCRRCLSGTYKAETGPQACDYCPRDATGHNATTLGDGKASMDACYFRPYVMSVVPRYGPVGGGTRVNVTLAYLQPEQRLVRVWFNDISTTNCTREDPSFLCDSPPSPTNISGPIKVEMMDAKSEYSPKSHHHYSYMPNPSIDLVENPKTILSGGILITVRGQHLTSVAQPEMIVTRIYKKNNTKSFPSDCQVTNSTLMLCPTPDLQKDADNIFNLAETDDTKPTRRRRQADNNGEQLNDDNLDYQVGFKFDGVNTFTDTRHIIVFPDPVYKRFHGKHALRYYHASRDDHVSIQGERLDYSVTLKDVDVMVGEGSCKVLSLVTNLLTCQPPKSYPGHGTRGPGPGSSHYVQVAVGNLRFHIGYLKYVNEEIAAKEVILGMSLLGVLLLWVIVATAVIVWWQRCRHNRRKQEAKFPRKDKVFTAVGESSPRNSASSSEAADFLFAGNGSSNNSDDTVTTGVPSLEVDAVENVENAQMVHIDIWSVLEDPLKSKVTECQIDSHRLTLGECIGVGSFGRVFKGEMDAEDGSKIPVAVKTLRGKYWCVTPDDESAGAVSPGQLPPLRVLGIPSAALWAQSDPTSRIITKYGFTSADELPQFLEEGLVMAGFRHENILPLYGVAVSDCLPFVVSEFMDLGDLRSYVKNASEESISVKACLGLSRQVAEGMVYLSQQGFLHRDLAARNCLINSSGVVKIGDFGLSRDLHGQDYYRIGDMGRPLPVKWMAIESLNLGKFFTKSDVWSFGIVLWELLTRGRTPYRTVNNIDLKDYLNNDNRLSKPAGAPDKVYDIMASCWRVNPADRPTFEDLVKRLTDVLRQDDITESISDVSIVQIEHDDANDEAHIEMPIVKEDYTLPIDAVITPEDDTPDLTVPGSSFAVTNEASKPELNNKEESLNIASDTSDVTAQPHVHIVTDAANGPDVTNNEGCSDSVSTPRSDEVNGTDVQLLLV